jgi:serine/threonine protein kinase
MTSKDKSSSSSSNNNENEYSIKIDLTKIYNDRVDILKKLNYNFIEITKKYHRKNRSAFIAKMDGIFYFIKIIYTDTIFGDEFIIYNKLKEYNHPNIIKYYSYHEYEKYTIIIYEYLNGVSLTKYLEENELTEEKTKEMFIKIVNVIGFMHSLNIIHNDIKTDNIMVVDNEPIIVDFDLSLYLPERKNYNKEDSSILLNRTIGTQNYIAPESFHLSIYSKKSDIWGLGILLFYMITKNFPFDNSPSLIENDNLIIKKNIFKYPNLTQLYILVNEHKYNNSVVNLITSLLSFYDIYRPSCRKIVKFEWLNYTKI